MRSSFKLTFAALCLVGCSGTESTAPTRQPFDPATMTAINKAIDDTMVGLNVPGAVVLIDFPGRGYFVAAKGEGNRTTHELMKLDNKFRVGSNTKAFTGTVILQLIDEGQFTLETKVATLLPTVGVPNGSKISVRNMLNMTSGLVNYSALPEFDAVLHSDPMHNWTRQELLNLSFAHDVTFQPGEKWEYSNTNTVLLGMIIEARTGKSVATNFQERIYNRVGMKNTNWPLGSAFPLPHAHGITDDTTDRSVVDATNWNVSWADAAGQLVSDLSDMSLWARAMGTGSLISPRMQAERLNWVHVPGNDGTYGLAIGRAGGFLHHQGELPGFNTIAAYLPPYDGTMVVLTNSNVPWDEPGPAARIMKALAEVVAPEYAPGVPQDDQ